MTMLGVIISALTATALVFEVLHQKRQHFPVYGWMGIIILILAEWLLFQKIEPLATYFTPVAWSAYLLIVDAGVLAISGHSRLHDEPQHFAQMAVLSLLLWLIFEAYNLRLENWTYVGLPLNWAWAALGYGWSFATISPAIMETADLVESFGWFRPGRPVRFSRPARWIFVILGAVCLLLPLLCPRDTARYLFALVWIGFVFLLDPVNQWLGWPSLLADLAAGRRSRFYSLFISGWTCGWLWEFWNYWASAKWHYIFPMFQQWKIFEMPVPGYLGFLPFALECFVMYVTAAGALGLIKAEQPQFNAIRG
ncbi:MAG TPA: hypothetical protein VFJ47_16615 [Terriglobales bacterium]|nr:hypothetical protein [Terriglobales bacterium]